MTKIMTAPEAGLMTDDQIKNAIDKFRAAMYKHRAEISTDAAQKVLGVDNLGMLMFTRFREIAETVSNLIVRKVRVNCNRSPQQALDATGRAQYTNRKVVDSMPKAVADKAEIVFFELDLSERDGRISDDDLEAEYAQRGFGPVDPITLASLNEDDKAFADEKPNCTHWKDKDGNWCFAAFDRWGGEREVRVNRYVYDWGGSWRFAGVRK